MNITYSQEGVARMKKEVEELRAKLALYQELEASIPAIEARALEKFGHKQLGYLGANTGANTQDYYESVAEDALQEAANLRKEQTK